MGISSKVVTARFGDFPPLFVELFKLGDISWFWRIDSSLQVIDVYVRDLMRPLQTLQLLPSRPLHGSYGFMLGILVLLEYTFSTQFQTFYRFCQVLSRIFL